MNVILANSLQKFWGYSEFRPNQLDVCAHILQHHKFDSNSENEGILRNEKRRDCFVVMATGSGKSLMFQLPVVAVRDYYKIKSTSIVISPLISLMEDQVSQLTSMGILACSLGSGSNLDTELKAQRGYYTVIYMTPEKFSIWKQGIITLKKNALIVCIAVDECHCVCDWGHDFRPEYRKLGGLRKDYGLESTPVIALTASATRWMEADIVDNLQLHSPLTVKSSLNRPNLKYSVISKDGPSQLIRLLSEYRQEQLHHCQSQSVGRGTETIAVFHPTLIYVNTKQECEDLARCLVTTRHLEGIRAAFYHGGMAATDRTAVHRAFSRDDIQVVIATVAFGMGINKPDVRLVVHYGMTSSLETYYQQTGRAGRDGLPARCILMYSRNDRVKCYNIAARDWELRHHGSVPPSSFDPSLNPTSTSGTTLYRLNEQLNTICDYAQGSSGCRRRSILLHFEEESQCPENHPGCCDLCDERLRRPLNRDPTRTGQELNLSVELRMLLTTFLETGEAFGINLTVSILLGRHDKSVRRIGNYDSLSFFGKGSCHSAEWWKEFAYQLCDDREGEGMVRSVLTKPLGSLFAYQRYIVTTTGRHFVEKYGICTPTSPSCVVKGDPLNPVDHRLEGATEEQMLKFVCTPRGSFKTECILEKKLCRSSRDEDLGEGHVDEVTIHKNRISKLLSLSAKLQRSLMQPHYSTEDVDLFHREAASMTNPEVSVLRLNVHHSAELEQLLMKTRREVARAQDLSPYTILSASDVQEMIQRVPTEVSALVGMSGWGDKKRDLFGEQFCSVIRTFIRCHQLSDVSIPRQLSDVLTPRQLSDVLTPKQLCDVSILPPTLEKFKSESSEVSVLYKPSYDNEAIVIGSLAKNQDLTKEFVRTLHNDLDGDTGKETSVQTPPTSSSGTTDLTAATPPPVRPKTAVASHQKRGFLTMMGCKI